MTTLILLPFLTVIQHELGTRKVLFWSVITDSKDLFSHSNLIGCFYDV